MDEIYFKHLVAKASLFKSSEKIVQAQNFGGYRANIVTYTLAYLSYSTERRIDLDAIWKQQSISQVLQEAIAMVSVQVHQAIVNTPEGRNVTEWCKYESCWKQIQSLNIKLPAELLF